MGRHKKALEGVAELYAAGATGVELGKRFGVSPGTVLKRLHEAGVVVRRQGPPVNPEHVREEVALYESGKCPREIAALTGRSEWAIRNHVSRAGTKMRPRGRPNGSHGKMPDKVLKWAQLRNDGLTLRAIADQEGCTRQNIFSALKFWADQIQNTEAKGAMEVEDAKA